MGRWIGVFVSGWVGFCVCKCVSMEIVEWAGVFVVVAVAVCTCVYVIVCAHV